MLTAPIDHQTKNNKILNVKFKDDLFKKKHLKTIKQTYAKK